MSGRPITNQLEHQPGLDGIRAVAVVAVLLFHCEVANAGGGFLGVSLFFTLSGYLITTLLLREHAVHGRISLREFWHRRIRRLAPVALVTIAVVLITGPLWLGTMQQRHLRGDALASAADVANWHFALTGRAYADLFAAPSPLQHLWSLGIEEQFYVALPLLVVAVLRSSRGARGPSRLGVVAGALLGASLVAAATTANDTVAYYGTHTRAGELLAGVLLAIVLIDRPARVWSHSAQRAAGVAGVIALGTFALLVARCGTGSRWLDHGGLTLLSAVWVALIVGALVPGPLRSLLSLRPFVAVGRTSYGIYVLHWPLFLVLTSARTGQTGVALVVVRLAVTGAAAAACYRWIEHPLRYPTARRPRPLVGPAFAAAVAGVVVVALVAPLPAASRRTVADVPATPVRFAAAPAPPPIHIVVVGSEPAVAVRLAAAAATLSGEASVTDATDGECPLFRAVPSPCDDRPDPESRVARSGPTDVVVLAVGHRDRLLLGPATGPVAVATAQGLDVDQWRTADAAVRVRVGRLLATAQPVVVADDEPFGAVDLVGHVLSQLVLAAPSATAVDTNLADRDLLEAVMTRVRRRSDPRVNVLVIGDSTSYSIARELDAQGGSRLDVLWAGRDNCPLAPSYEGRWWSAVTNREDDCPSVAHGWSAEVASFRPAVVVAIDSLPELADQRYGPDDSWHAPGDPAWEADHLPVADGIAAMLEPLGAKLLIADAPPITTGGFAGSPMAQPRRLEAWNAMVAAWCGHSETVRLLPYGEEVTALERTEGHSLRPDGVHLSDDGATDVVRDLVLPTVYGSAGITPPRFERPPPRGG